MRRLIAPAAAALLLLPSAATAAEPSSGQVSKGSPTVTWTGATLNAWFNYTLINADNTSDCMPTFCDRFTLTVVDGGIDLAVRIRMDDASSDGSNGTGGIRITPPTGDPTWTTGESGPDRDLKATVKKAPAGDYLIDFVNTFVGGEQTHTATAELLVPPPPPPPVVAPAAVTTTTAAAETVTLTVKPFRARAGKRLSARLSSGGPLTGLTATLKKGRRKAATGKLARLDGTGKLTLKARRKLKPGRYVLTVTGKDAQGRTVSGRATVTIRR